ncbi:MAG: histidine kinase [Candidatus Dactylopiibacterium carminicum]|nr:MAG: histidine kinase [Candidatus Dactylopiibacterium carminicum]
MPQKAGSIDPILYQALEWQVTFWSGKASADEKAAFQAWLASAPTHRDAWHKVQALHGRMADLPDKLGAQVLRNAPIRQGRRRVLGALLWLAGGSLAIGTARQTPQWHLALADHATRIGERRQILLSDGTRIDLNSASAVDVRYDEETRHVTLRKGEILISTAPDNTTVKRPFLVATARGEIQALGIRFRVQEDGSQIRVAVFEGAVALRPAEGKEVRLEAGEQARFDRRQIIAEGLADTDATAWIRGQLIAEHQRLADFLTQLARYRSGLLRCDPAVADLPISGVFPLDDTDRVLAALSEALPVQVNRITPYWVTIAPLP